MEFQVFWRKFCPLVVGNTKNTVKNYCHFAEFVRGKTLKADQVLVSLDVVSLFTIIPVDLAIKVATKRLRHDATLASVPVSLSFWKSFVDDVISAVSRNEIDILMQHLNSIEPSIQFTVEREINGHLAFLDLNVHRTVEGKLETDVYRKPTHTDKYLSYDSHHPVSHRRSVAKTLLQRAESLPSNSDSQANEHEYVLNILGENDNPKRFLNDCLRSPACRNQNNSEGDTSVKGYAIVPYIQGVTEPIKRILSNCNIKVP